jgi:cyclopropane fatty-acyl-phospholipid synthase-like methyltransferase
MATQSEIEAIYDWVHFFHTLRSGEYADFSCAFFDGNFNQTLPEAQRRNINGCWMEFDSNQLTVFSTWAAAGGRY